MGCEKSKLTNPAAEKNNTSKGVNGQKNLTSKTSSDHNNGSSSSSSSSNNGNSNKNGSGSNRKAKRCTTTAVSSQVTIPEKGESGGRGSKLRSFTEYQVDIIHSTWPLLSVDLAATGTSVFMDIFSNEPAIRRLFPYLR